MISQRNKTAPTFEELYKEAKVKAQKKKELMEKNKKDKEA